MPATKAARTESSKAAEPTCWATESPPNTDAFTAAAAESGSPATATWAWYVELRMLPRNEAPNAGPSFTTAWRSAAPTPLRSGESSTSAADAAVAKPMPPPRPTMKVHPAMNPSPLVAVIVAPTSEPTTTTANPSATVSLAPIRAFTRSAVTAPTRRPATVGRRRNPEPCGSTPMIAWKYWGSPNSTPNSPKIPTEVRSTPQVKLREWKSDRSMRGSPPGSAVSLLSHATNNARTTSPATTGRIALVLPQP